ncbi:SpoIID/LytB domain-containing protein [Prochlorococcus sp. AH-736-A13]|nr:SpoIID/LytB domain-containing protein [Prochlorococcus sp. AH-736-A13]
MILKFKNNYSKCCLITILFICVFHSQSVSAFREPRIRVLISKNNNLRIRSDRSIPLIIEGEFFTSKKVKGLTLKNEKDRKILYFDKNKQKKYDLKSNQKFQIRSFDGRGIWVGQKRFPGKLNLLVLDSEILVVNVLGIEKYLSSVVGSEMPTKWPIEALKAQAIASRTYALKQKGNNLFDIDSTEKNQVYNGLESRTYKTIRAVKSTRSLVLTYKNKLINALFHSSSGGMTENSEDVWKNKYPYLSSVKDFDKNNPKFRWQKNFSSDELINLFPKIGGLRNIEILDITSTGRVKNVKLIGAYDSDQMSGVLLRKRLGLKSNFVRFKFFEEELNNKFLEKKGLIVFGQGSGHGVGMSQWGAKYLASRGQKAERILKYFYRDVQIKPFRKDYL